MKYFGAFIADVVKEHPDENTNHGGENGTLHRQRLIDITKLRLFQLAFGRFFS